MNERVKVISRDGVQLVELPSSMTLADGEWTVHRQGAAVVLEPVPNVETGSAKALLALLATWEPLDEVFSEIDDLPPEPVLCFDDKDENHGDASSSR